MSSSTNTKWSDFPYVSTSLLITAVAPTKQASAIISDIFLPREELSTNRDKLQPIIQNVVECVASHTK